MEYAVKNEEVVKKPSDHEVVAWWSDILASCLGQNNRPTRKPGLLNYNSGTLGGRARSEELRQRYPPIEPFTTGRIDVGSSHSLYYEQCGNPNGKPVLFLHGGPGAGCSPGDRTFFEPQQYHVILFDQRGAGRSTPSGSLNANTTWDIIKDIELLRVHLSIDKWMLFGGSWGSTLALTYAIECSHRVTEIILRGVFMCRKAELDYFFQNTTQMIFPDAYDGSFAAYIPEAERGDLLKAYYSRLTSDDKNVRLEAAKKWTTWELSSACLKPHVDIITHGEDPIFAMNMARIETHYFSNKGFFTDDYFFKNINLIRTIPTVIVQGRYDMICPFRTAFELHRAFPEAELVVCGESGHASIEPEIMSELVRACDNFAGLSGSR